jgi:hypothetical protein
MTQDDIVKLTERYPGMTVYSPPSLGMVTAHPGNHRITLGADKAYDVAEFVADLRELNVTDGSCGSRLSLWSSQTPLRCACAPAH